MTVRGWGFRDLGICLGLFGQCDETASDVDVEAGEVQVPEHVHAQFEPAAGDAHHTEDAEVGSGAVDIFVVVVLKDYEEDLVGKGLDDSTRSNLEICVTVCLDFVPGSLVFRSPLGQLIYGSSGGERLRFG